MLETTTKLLYRRRQVFLTAHGLLSGFVVFSASVSSRGQKTCQMQLTQPGIATQPINMGQKEIFRKRTPPSFCYLKLNPPTPAMQCRKWRTGVSATWPDIFQFYNS